MVGIGIFVPDLREIIVGFTAFVQGVLLYLALGINLRSFFKTRNRRALAYAIARTGVVISVTLIGEAVLHAIVVPITWRAVLYAISLCMISGGYFYIALTDSDRRRRGGEEP